MRILDELRCLRELFVKNARRFLHLLSTSAQKARADITKLLHKYYTLLFADAPARVYQVMVDFNRWLAEMLEDTRSEGIEWGPSYGENPWLALEEQPQDGTLEAFTVDNAGTIQLLRSACEYYISRCESLQQTNIGLASQLDELKTKLKEALVRAFESQQALEREREVSALQSRRLVMGVQIGDHLLQENSHDRCPTGLHQQIADAFRMLDEVRAAPHEGSETASEATSMSDFERDSSEVEVEDDQAEDVSAPETTNGVEVAPVYQQELPPLTPSMDDKGPNEGHEASQSSETQVDSEPTPFSVAVVEPISKCESSDYHQLTKLQASERKDGTWYKYALRTLKEKREQRRFLRKSKLDPAEAPYVATTTTDVLCTNSSSLDDQEYVQLVATRDRAEDGEDSTWYRKALQHLKEERQRRMSLRDRDSFTSTISIVD